MMGWRSTSQTGVAGIGSYFFVVSVFSLACSTGGVERMYTDITCTVGRLLDGAGGDS